MTPEDADTLREMAVRHLNVNLANNPNTQGVLDALMANVAAWRLGWDPEQFHYWVAPITADGRMLPGPMNGVLRWDWHDFQAIKNYKLRDLGPAGD